MSYLHTIPFNKLMSGLPTKTFIKSNKTFYVPTSSFSFRFCPSSSQVSSGSRLHINETSGKTVKVNNTTFPKIGPVKAT